MRIVTIKTLVALAERYPPAAMSLQSWRLLVEHATWKSMNDVMAQCPSAKVIDGDRVRFAIRGGAYRLIASFDFGRGVVYVKFFGTHAEYDRIDARTVGQF